MTYVYCNIELDGKKDSLSLILLRGTVSVRCSFSSLRSKLSDLDISFFCQNKWCFINILNFVVIWKGLRFVMLQYHFGFLSTALEAQKNTSISNTFRFLKHPKTGTKYFGGIPELWKILKHVSVEEIRLKKKKEIDTSFTFSNPKCP